MPHTPRFYGFSLIAVLATVGIVAVLAALIPLTIDVWRASNPTNSTPNKPIGELRSGATCSALADRIERAGVRRYGFVEDIAFLSPTAGVAQKSSEDFSTTNIQVAGVDEADIVKTDGSHIYAVNRDTLTILAADADTGMQTASQTALGITPSEMFVNGNTLVVFGVTSVDVGESVYKENPFSSASVAQLWDVADRAAPRKIRTLEFEGMYKTSRMIGDDVYLVLNSYPRVYAYDEATPTDAILPAYRDATVATAAYQPVAKCADVAYTDTMLPEQFVVVAAFSLDQPEGAVTKKVLLGSGENVYASTDTLYVAGTSWNPRVLVAPSIVPDETGTEEETVVQVFSLASGSIAFRGSFDVPGHVLNQFSMDEHENVFRIATTRGRVSRIGTGTTNNVYLYDNSFTRIGAVEDLAPGETIYSVRFMGDRGYVVTFQKVDPLFALDLSDPTNPRVLGKLKIPGYSDYLHPFDETHLIGVGKEAVPSDEGNFSWYQGLKIALFDVTDPTNPTQLSAITIGDRGSDSYALHDHKAFLFSKSKNLLVLPILLATIPEDQKDPDAPTTYGDYEYQGAYVYSLTIDKGFELRGRVTHYTSDETFKKSGYFYYGDGNSVKRSLYIGDVLYTVSQNAVLANRLDDLTALGRASLCQGACQNDSLMIER
jgi:uncharacterized secreted protein with C-terminal beta-propeller domain